MLRLKPSRIHGTELPPIQNLYTIQGKTTLFYKWNLANTYLQVFTIEEIKLKWWQHLGLISNYVRAGYAAFDGYLNENPYYKEFPVFYAVVPVIQKPEGEFAAQLELINNTLDMAYNRWKIVHGDPWNSIEHYCYNHHQLESVIDFIWPHRENYYPDMGAGDWMVWDNELICIDPYHAKSVNVIFKMTRSLPK